MAKMTVYHGGYISVENPQVRIGRNTKDFGTGFYCTVIKEQAQRWAKRYDTKVVSIYEVRLNLDLNIKEFQEMTEEWLDFIIDCRSGKSHNYDIVIEEIIERCHEDINVKKKYIIAFSEMASLCITKASELLGENIIINRIFLINPSKAKESDLYLGDISIIDGNSVAIKSWEKAVLGNVREFESNSNDIFDIIMRELENDK